MEGVCTMQNSPHLSLLLTCQGLCDSWLVLQKGLCCKGGKGAPAQKRQFLKAQQGSIFLSTPGSRPS